MNHKPYDSFEGHIAARHITLAINQLRAQAMIPDSAYLETARLESFRDEVARKLIIELSAKVATKKYEVKTVRFPADWWQAVRRRFLNPAWRLSRWALKRWPIQYTEVTMEASAYYPEVRIPGGHHAFVEIAQMSQIRQMEESDGEYREWPGGPPTKFHQ